MGKTNILVVDDLQSIRLTLGGILEEKGYNVATAENGYQAIEAVRKAHFDVIFMDIKMPGINGVQTFREVKKIDSKAVVIMMTAYSVEELVKEALEEGAYAIIYKPFDIDKIVAIIEEVLNDVLILMIDDQLAGGERLKRILEDKGYRVATAWNGAEAVEMVKSRHYDIIFLDARLPDMAGIETFERVKQTDPQATVIMMTNSTEEDLVKQAVSRGVYACICKPFDAEKVIGVVEDIVRRRKG